MIRLDKYLADMGVGTRSEVKQMIRKGRVCVEGLPAKKPEMKIDERSDRVSVDGSDLSYVTYEYYMLNKPAGVVSATEDRLHTTVVDLIDAKKRKDLFPVGRLDIDTEGLLLITNDGALSHRLLSPKKHVDKTYVANVRGTVTEDTVRRFREGLDIGTPECAEWTKPGRLEIITSGEVSEIRLTIQEGKYHHVKRMFLAVGMEVLHLKRESMGTLRLDETLKPGEYRALTKEELEKLG